MDKQAEAERAKYTRIWAYDQYRCHSPGETLAPTAWGVMRPVAGETLGDFGAGPGRATAWFRTMGLGATAIDFVADALETDVPFREANLWDMPDDLGSFDWGYCCDVMEHIPPDRVDAVLAGIAARVGKGCLFQIALFKDGMGKLIGEPLHLTVQPADWWSEVLSQHFRAVDVVSASDKYLTVLARP